jgi:hypothetical protein
MKTRRPSVSLRNRLICLIGFPLAPSVLAQGNLAPPGAPAPTMKTLEQIEPRTPIQQSDVPLNILARGSYYLTEDLYPVGFGEDLIVIGTDSVTLDLNGYTLNGATPVSEAGHGIRVNGARTNITVRNGAVRDCVVVGVEASSAVNSQFLNLQVFRSVGDGLRAGNNAIVRECVAEANGGRGIVTGPNAVIRDSISTRNTVSGIAAGANSVVADCVVTDNVDNGINTDVASTVIGCVVSGNLNGISPGPGSVVRDCSVWGNQARGINATGPFVQIRDCTVANNGSHGIQITSHHVVENNLSSGNSGAGVFFAGIGNRIEANQFVNNQVGVHATGLATNNIIVRNMARGNATNYAFVANNKYGPIINLTAGGQAAVSGDSAASAIGTTHPWANFAY